MKLNEHCFYCLTINEAKRVKALNENDLVTADEYDESVILDLKLWALSLPVPEFTEQEFETFIDNALRAENIYFLDNREIEYLRDVMRDNLRCFKEAF